MENSKYDRLREIGREADKLVGDIKNYSIKKCIDCFYIDPWFATYEGGLIKNTCRYVSSEANYYSTSQGCTVNFKEEENEIRKSYLNRLKELEKEYKLELERS